MPSNYPPGVTGNEFEIAGPDYEEETDIPCPYTVFDDLKCGASTTEYGYRGRGWLVCDDPSQHITDLPDNNHHDDEIDRAYDAMIDKQMGG